MTLSLTFSSVFVYLLFTETTIFEKNIFEKPSTKPFKS